MAVELSQFAQSLKVETAFTVLALARQLKSIGKDVVELEIGDSPFPTPAATKSAGIQAIEAGETHYCPSPGIPGFREAAAQLVRNEFQIPATAANIVVAPGAKVFEQFFCEAFLNPGDSALVFSPYFPTYLPNIKRRGANAVFASLRQETGFRPQLSEIESFMKTAPSPRAIFLNSPHNPTGGVTPKEDLEQIADLIRGRDVAVFSDEPYCHMVWNGKHHSLLAESGMLEQGVAAFTFSKSYSMSGWRLGFAVTAEPIATAISKMINTTLSCTPPFVQMAGITALTADHAERSRQMEQFRKQVELLTAGINSIEGFHALPPAATFYVFPNVAPVCNRLGITSHGLALFLLEGADNQFGVACLGGECFGEAGHGFLRFSCAEPPERLQAAVDFLKIAIQRPDRVQKYLEKNPVYRLARPYDEPPTKPLSKQD